MVCLPNLLSYVTLDCVVNVYPREADSLKLIELPDASVPL